jgi:hypothetical protein
MMRLSPVSLVARKANVMTQQPLRDSVARAHQITTQILTRPNLDSSVVVPGAVGRRVM